MRERVRVLVHLENGIPAFAATERQLADLARSLPGVALVHCANDADFAARLPEADAVVVWRFERDWYARAPKLAHVFTPAAGKEAIEPDPSGRVALHFGHFHGHLMAESLVAMVSFMNRRFGVAMAAQRERRWERAVYADSHRLAGQTALIVGYGAIGEHCGRLLAALGMRVHGVRRDPSRGGAFAERVFGVEALLEAVTAADHVACVLPGDTGTDSLLGAPAFARMKPTAYVYNLGRGNAVDAPALVSALKSGQIAGAFLDVVPEEPLPASSPLWDVPNLYLTPHASAIQAEYLDLYFADLSSELANLSVTA
jgi:D-2-hydroxyacid dehydrogenase (NADP+)